MSWDFEYPWDALTNEISALQAAIRRGRPEEFDHQSDRTKCEITCVLCYYTRNVVAMLLSTDTRASGARLERMLPNFRSEVLDRLRDEYGDHSIEGSPCALIDSLAEDPEPVWRPKQDVAQAIARLLPLIDKVWKEIQPLRPKRQLRKPSEYGGDML